ncbi:hypothetical protein BDM02DRAFT_3118737 [Thelephora ganbajun]|uniref:Uncharacterized protein n=1 Tax=Thelephora ganbajun TaxID=370292 RepID=A0ACB6ZA78_THEGA|nr:hypothetical protein BDM02DRAFT_3118737 [Thelephora ganbajun]
MEEYPGSGLSISQLLQALNRAVGDSMAEARRYGRYRLSLSDLPHILTYPFVQDDLQHK